MDSQVGFDLVVDELRVTKSVRAGSVRVDR